MMLGDTWLAAEIRAVAAWISDVCGLTGLLSVAVYWPAGQQHKPVAVSCIPPQQLLAARFHQMGQGVLRRSLVVGQ